MGFPRNQGNFLNIEGELGESLTFFLNTATRPHHWRHQGRVVVVREKQLLYTLTTTRPQNYLHTILYCFVNIFVDFLFL